MQKKYRLKISIISNDIISNRNYTYLRTGDTIGNCLRLDKE